MEYKICELNDSNYDIAIFSTSSCNPFNSLSEIELKLRKLDKKANVLFDMLTSNGNNNRFGSLEFDGNNLIRKSYKDVKVEKNSELRLKLNKFYSSNFDSISITTIPKSLAFLIKNNYISKF